jgi:hypothetical protein
VFGDFGKFGEYGVTFNPARAELIENVSARLRIDQNSPELKLRNQFKWRGTGPVYGEVALLGREASIVS